jgi:hypothetical protein
VQYKKLTVTKDIQFQDEAKIISDWKTAAPSMSTGNMIGSSTKMELFWDTKENAKVVIFSHIEGLINLL